MGSLGKEISFPHCNFRMNICT